MKLGRSIKIARKKTGVTQAKLAHLIGCTEGYVAHLEHSRSLPSELKLLQICEILNLPKRDMIKRRQSEKAPDEAKPYYAEADSEDVYFRDGHKLTASQMEYALKVIQAVECNDKVKNAIDLIIGLDYE